MTAAYITRFCLILATSIHLPSVHCKRTPNNQIIRNSLVKEAIFLKTLTDVEVRGIPLSYLDNTTLVSCGRSCLREPACESFTFKRTPTTMCKLLGSTVESSEFLAVPTEGWDYYAPQKKRELPCKLLKDGKNADSISKALYGKVLSGESAAILCDQSTDGGGWTMITSYNHTLFSGVYTESITSNEVTKIVQVETNNFLLGQTGFVQLYRLFNFRQVRFYCARKEDGLTLDMATVDSELGDWVLAHLLGFTPNNRPPSCASYYELPSPQPAYILRNCEQWAEQKWNALDTVFIQNPFSIPGVGQFAPLSNGGGCDNMDVNTDRRNLFRIYVR